MPPKLNGALLGLDYGQKRIGIAYTDAEHLLTRPLETLDRRKTPNWLERLVALAKEKAVAGVVIGLPLNMDGSEGPMAEEVRRFAKRLAPLLPCPLVLVDERLSSWQAEEELKEAGLSPSKNRALVDQRAACIILENYLASN
jgi:putative Holliday junction resolvase